MDFVRLPDGREIDISQISEISPVVMVTELGNGSNNILGFSISLLNGKLFNVFSSFNEVNYVQIDSKLNHIHDDIVVQFAEINYK